MNQYPGKGPITVKRVLGSIVVALIVGGGMFIGGQLDQHANIQAQGGASEAKSKQTQASTEVCRSGGNQNECKVDLMAGLVPVVYDASIPSKWRTLAQAEDAQHAGAWYDYDQGKWANAVSFQPGAIDKYKGKDMPLDLNDVAAFWVYIPRYAYEVQRRDVTDKPVKPSNFAIQFETVSSPVRISRRFARAVKARTTAPSAGWTVTMPHQPRQRVRAVLGLPIPPSQQMANSLTVSGLLNLKSRAPAKFRPCCRISATSVAMTMRQPTWARQPRWRQALAASLPA